MTSKLVNRLAKTHIANSKLPWSFINPEVPVYQKHTIVLEFSSMIQCHILGVRIGIHDMSTHALW